MRKRYRIVLLTLVLLVLVAAVPFAPDIFTDWWAIGPGSQVSSAGSLTLEGMVGQPVAGEIESGSVRINSGFLQSLWEFLSNLFLPIIMK